MASIITADTGAVSGTAGLKQSADSSGVLALATGTGTTAVTIDTSGNVGIGTSSPATVLDISASSAGAYIGQTIRNTSATGYALTQYLIGSGGANGTAAINYAPGLFFAIGPVANDTTTPIVFRNSNATERARIDSSGNLLLKTTSQGGGAVLTVKSAGNSGIGQGIAVVKNDTTDYWSQNVDSLVGYTFGKNGSDFWYAGRSGSNNCVSSNGSWVNSSDARLKENIEPLQNCLQDVCKLQGVSFTRINGGQEEIGLIAQEVEKVFPRAVEPPSIDTDSYALNYGSLVAPLIEAIKEQQALITTLTERISALEAK